MSNEASAEPGSILASRAEYRIATAVRAPSVQNSQPWRFKVTESAAEDEMLTELPRRRAGTVG